MFLGNKVNAQFSPVDVFLTSRVWSYFVYFPLLGRGVPAVLVSSDLFSFSVSANSKCFLQERSDVSVFRTSENLQREEVPLIGLSLNLQKTSGGVENRPSRVSPSLGASSVAILSHMSSVLQVRCSSSRQVIVGFVF